MMKSSNGSKKSNRFLILSVIGAVILVGFVSFVLLSATATTKAAVLTSDSKAGTTITSDMVTEIDVPKDTPGDYYKTTDSLVGERLTSNVKANQLIYQSDLMSSIDVSSEDSSSNFVTTSIMVPDKNALGGMLVAGDTVDISVVPNEGDAAKLAKALPGYNIDTSLDGGVYYILANVKLLDTTTAVSSSQGSNMSTATGADDSKTASSSSDSGSYYMVSVSYDDFKKLRIAEQYGTLYLNLAPGQNSEKNPLLDAMSAKVKSSLDDASVDTTKSDSTSASSSSTSSSADTTTTGSAE